LFEKELLLSPCLCSTENLAKAGKAIQAILDATGTKKGKAHNVAVVARRM